MNITDSLAVLIGDFNKIGVNQESGESHYKLLNFLWENYPILNNTNQPSRGENLLDLTCPRIPGAKGYVDIGADIGSDDLPTVTILP